MHWCDCGRPGCESRGFQQDRNVSARRLPGSPLAVIAASTVRNHLSALLERSSSRSSSESCEVTNRRRTSQQPISTSGFSMCS
jgi:hypothetical protein